ncbi:MAG: hypothetical protein CSB47_03195 [Proteobacteria bacterium]|nr:MAG: hypothetical protein CSB47_03195 [Pseudomonadota bacterium]
MTQSKRMYLYLENKGKMLLDTQSILSIGRTPSNVIVISSLTVSRHHARIIYNDGAYFLQDMNSRNGTFLNGKRIRKARLSNGDQINIGGYQIGVQGEEDLPNDDEDTLRDIENVFATTIDIRREAFGLMVGNVTGDLSSISIDEIIQIIVISNKTGVLKLVAEDQLPRGEIFFNKGEITHAVSHDIEGTQAAIELLQTAAGAFEFLIDVQTKERSVYKTTMWLLYEAHRRRDEKNHV